MEGLLVSLTKLVSYYLGSDPDHHTIWGVIRHLSRLITGLVGIGRFGLG